MRDFEILRSVGAAHRASAMHKEEMTIGSEKDNSIIFYSSFSTVGKRWPALIKVADKTYRFAAQEAMDNNEFVVFGGKATYSLDPDLVR